MHATERADRQEIQAIWSDLVKKLQTGALLSEDLPDRFQEYLHIANASSEDSAAFQTYMEALTHKLLPGWDFQKHPIRFLIADTDEINAAAITAGKPTVILFNKGLLNLVDMNENKLLHVLGHELGHTLLREEIGDDLRITEPEEILVDLPHIQWMYENGLDPRPALHFALQIKALEKSASPEQSRKEKIDNIVESVTSIADEHMAPALDVDKLNNALTAYRHKVSGTFDDCKVLAVPEEMQTLFRRARHITPIEQAEQALPTPFEDMEWEDQLAFFLEQTKAARHGYQRQRAEDLFSLVQRIENDVDETSARMAIEVAKAIQDSPVLIHRLYGILNINLMNRAEDAPFGPVSSLANAMKATWQAKDSDAFASASEQVLEHLDRLQSFPLEKIKFPAPCKIQFNAASPQPQKAPWNSLAEWAIAMAGEGNDSGCLALAVMGIEDPRLFESLSIKGLGRILNNYDPASLSSFNILHLFTNAGGHRSDTQQTLPVLTKPVLNEKLYSLSLRNGDLFITKNSGKTWNAHDAICDILEDKVILNFLAEKEQRAKQTYTYDGTLPYTEESGFLKWFDAHRQSFLPPSCLTNTGSITKSFQSSLVFFEKEDPRMRETFLDLYRTGKNFQRDSRYNRLFIGTFTELYQPFEEQARQVVAMLSAQLSGNKEHGKDLVRAFFLNPPDQPGFQKTLRSADRFAFLPNQSAYVDFIAQTHDLFSPEEKAEILGPHLSFIFDKDWWEAFLMEGNPVCDLPSLLEFVDKIERFENHLHIPPATKAHPLMKTARAIKADFEEITPFYFTALLGLNYPGCLDISLLPQTPSRLIDQTLRKDLPDFSDLLEFDEFEPLARKFLNEESREKHTRMRQEESARENDDEDDDEYSENPKDYSSCLSDFIHRIREGETFNLPLQESQIIRDLVRQHIAEQKTWSESFIELARLYKGMDTRELFPSDHWQADFQDKLLLASRLETNTEARLEGIRILLDKSPLQNASLRHEIKTLYIETLRASLQERGLGIDGLDDGSRDYMDALTSEIEWSEAHMSATERYSLFVALADRLESQKDLSYRFEKSFQISKKTLEDLDMGTRVGEALLIYASNDSKARKATLDYLIKENNDDAQNGFAKWLYRTRKKASSTLDEEDSAFRSALDMTDDLQYYKLHAKNIFENFQSAPLPVRIAIFDQLLLTPEEKLYVANDSAATAEHLQAYTKAITYVMDELFPPNIAYAKESRAALTVWDKTLPANERSLFLSALLAANDRTRQATHTLSAGERLALICEIMGPAHIKFGQGISHYQGAPLEFRRPLARLTGKANPPTRWDLWRRYEDVVPKQHQESFTRMGPSSGSATYNYTVRMEKPDGCFSILSLQRPYVERLAESGFHQLRLFVQELGKDAATDLGIGENVADSADQILQQAQSMAGKETDIVYRLSQVEKAQTYYNGLTIKVEEFSFDLETATWLAYGVDRGDVDHRTDRKEWCEQEEMPGVHFDEIPEGPYKKAAAIAILTAELLVLMSGKPIDHDRHEAQTKFLDSHIGLFDHGGLDLDPPTAEEKQALGSLLIQLVQNHKPGAALSNTIHCAMQEMKDEKGNIPAYLVKVERAFLALTPFFEQLEPDDLKDIVKAVHKTKTIAPEILKTRIPVTIGTISLNTALNTMSNGKNRIEIGQSPIKPVPPPLRFDRQEEGKRAFVHPSFSEELRL